MSRPYSKCLNIYQQFFKKANLAIYKFLFYGFWQQYLRLKIIFKFFLKKILCQLFFLIIRSVIRVSRYEKRTCRSVFRTSRYVFRTFRYVFRTFRCIFRTFRYVFRSFRYVFRSFRYVFRTFRCVFRSFRYVFRFLL